MILFSAVQVFTTYASGMPYSATRTQIIEGRQNELESCLLAGLLIQTKFTLFSSEIIVPVDSGGLSTLVCNQTRGTCCSNT